MVFSRIRRMDPTASFDPLFRNPHLLTVAGHFWPRRTDTRRFPVVERLIETEPGVRVLVKSQEPPGEPRGDFVLVHGLESSAEAGYMRSMAQAALEAGYRAHRFQLRSCGDTGHLSPGFYHAGLTVDLHSFLGTLREPAWLVGYSLGGNVVLKLAGELCENAASLMAGLCAISTPIDLEACGRRIGERQNRIYERRFVRRLRHKLAAARLFSEAELRRGATLWEFDDRFTAPLWGFRSAEHYYRTQSANQYLERIRVPALLIQAQDDPIIPFSSFPTHLFTGNPHLRLLAPKHGGHLGFLSRRGPRFWTDTVVLEWVRRGEQLPRYTRLRSR